MKVNLRLISTYRAELMGLAALMIIISHAPANGVCMPSAIERVIRSWGNIGVGMFLFLSGMGMYFSLRKKNYSIKKWYYNRYTRILIPYLVFSIPYYIFRWFIENDSIYHLFENITTLSFWTRHKGAWFVALLLTLYMVTPLIAKIIDKAKKNRLNHTIILCVIIVIVSQLPIEGAVINNIQWCLHSVPSYILGYWFGKIAYEGKEFKVIDVSFIMIALCFVYVIFMYIHLPKDYLIIIPLITIVAVLLNFDRILTKTALYFMGGVSLESYLTNIYLPVFLRRMGYAEYMKEMDSCNYIFYTIVIVVGISLAYLGHKFSQKIIKSIP